MIYKTSTTYLEFIETRSFELFIIFLRFFFLFFFLFFQQFTIFHNSLMLFCCRNCSLLFKRQFYFVKTCPGRFLNSYCFKLLLNVIGVIIWENLSFIFVFIGWVRIIWLMNNWWQNYISCVSWINCYTSIGFNVFWGYNWSTFWILMSGFFVGSTLVFGSAEIHSKVTGSTNSWTIWWLLSSFCFNICSFRIR